MSVRRAQLFSLGLLLLSVFSTAGFAHFTSVAQEAAKADDLARDPLLKELVNYRQWIRVNEKPLPVFNATPAV